MARLDNPAETQKIRRTRSLAFRISLLVSLAIIIFGALATYIVTDRQGRLYRSEKLRQWEILIDAFTPNLMNMLASSNFDGINQILNKLASENEEIHHIYLANESGEILYSTELELEGKKLPAKTIKSLGIHYRQDPSSGVMIVQYERKIRSGISRLGTLYMGFNFLSSLEKERMTSILTLENAIQGAVRKYLIEMDFYQVNFITKEMIKGIKDVAYFEVVSADGTIVSSPKDKEILQPVKDKYDLSVLSKVNIRRPVWTRKLTVNRHPILEVTLGAFEGENSLGMIKVGYDMSSLNADMRRSQIILGVVTLISVFLAVLLASRIASRIARPARLLVDVSREIGKGNLDVQAEVSSGGDEMRLLGIAFNQMIKGLKERNMIRDTFSRYVSKQVAEELLKDPEKISLGGENKEVTILFSDIRGFTTMSERLSAEKVVATLNEYFNSMVDVVFEYEGTLDKYIGDAIMAVFGSPASHPDDPMRAVRTAVKMRAKLNELNEKRKVDGDEEPIRIGIGINTGNVIAGNIGHIQRMEYTVIGDNVNLASRIEGLTKNYNCHIIIAESTYEKVRDFVHVKKLGGVTVKGKTQPVDIFELLGLKNE